MKKTLLLSALAGGAAIVVASLGLPSTGQAASLQFTLADCNNGAACSPQTGNNFGTVTITDGAAGVVNVDVDLAGSFTWAKTGLIGFAFNLAAGLPVPTLSNVTATNWTPTSGSPLIIAYSESGGKPYRRYGNCSVRA